MFLVELGDMLKLTNFTLHNERVRVSGMAVAILVLVGIVALRAAVLWSAQG